MSWSGSTMIFTPARAARARDDLHRHHRRGHPRPRRQPHDGPAGAVHLRDDRPARGDRDHAGRRRHRRCARRPDRGELLHAHGHGIGRGLTAAAAGLRARAALERAAARDRSGPSHSRPIASTRSRVGEGALRPVRAWRSTSPATLTFRTVSSGLAAIRAGTRRRDRRDRTDVTDRRHLRQGRRSGIARPAASC